MNKAKPTLEEVRLFYDQAFHRRNRPMHRIPNHLRRLARRLGPWEGKQVLDVGCGTGEWLRAIADWGAIPTGIDISQVAVHACRERVPEAVVRCGPAESLPFESECFDAICCLGSLEHFLDPQKALLEMVRVAKLSAFFLFLVPNAGFLTRRLRLYRGTEQATIREDVRTLGEWAELFGSARLRVRRRWRDLHVLSLDWILRGNWYVWPVRAAQAAALPFWPLSWQYQVYHLCEFR